MSSGVSAGGHGVTCAAIPHRHGAGRMVAGRVKSW